MKKSVYSLVLSDAVIRAADKEACRLGTSRSNLIDQILARQLSCMTPEMRMRDIFDSLSVLADHSLQIQQQRSSSLMTLRTALEFKYRPTVNYKVELDRIPDRYIGTLRVHIRTQNENLINMFNSFFVYRARAESALTAARGVEGYTCELMPGSFTRRLFSPDLDEEKTGEAMSEYINDLNNAVQLYFSQPQRFEEYIPQLEAKYNSMLDKYII